MPESKIRPRLVAMGPSFWWSRCLAEVGGNWFSHSTPGRGGTQGGNTAEVGDLLLHYHRRHVRVVHLLVEGRNLRLEDRLERGQLRVDLRHQRVAHGDLLRGRP